MKKQLLFAACVTFVTVAAAHAQTVAITGGTVYPVSGPAIQNGTVLMRDGKIVAVGADVAIPAGAQRIDATGKIVTPGFIAASFRSWDGLNSESVNWAPARNEGVTSAVVLPGGGLVSGGAAMVDLADGTAAQMIRRAPVAMIAQIDNPRSAQTGARGELIGKLRNLIEDVKFYQTHRADYDR